MNPFRMSVAASVATLAAIAVCVAAWTVADTPDAVFGSDIGSRVEPSGNGSSVVFTLAEGETADDIAHELERLGVIRSASQFSFLVDLTGVGDLLRADTYSFQQGSSSATVLQTILTQDLGEQITLTFPEGLRNEEMAALIEEQTGLATTEQVLAAVDAAELPENIAAILPEGQDRQGLLFPDTYFFTSESTAEDIVSVLLATMSQKLGAELNAELTEQYGLTLDQAMAQSGLSLYEAIVMASIIERETALPAERPLISSVFHNRLEQGMTLGADPTVQFVVAMDPASVAEFGWWKPGSELTEAELADTSPYNTRVNLGLPPGPITNPSLASIVAALAPAETSDLYFVADTVAGDGSHVFAETLEEHNRNIELYFNPE